MTGAPHLLHAFSTFTAAGPQLRTVELIEALGDRFRHSVVALDGRAEAREQMREPRRARLVPAPEPGPPLARIRRMRALLRAQRPDLLLTYNWGAVEWLLAARALPELPIVHHEDGFNDDEARGQKRRRVWARRFALRRAFRVVVPSARLLEIARGSWRVGGERALAIPNGVDAERFAPAPPPPALRAELGIDARALVVGSVGHLRPIKRYDRLIEACAALGPRLCGEGAPPVDLLLVGDGAERARLELLARAAPPPGGAVHFAGHRAQLAEWLRAMDVYALSSDSEQHPISLLEAMACGLPVAATDVGDVRRVLPEEQQDFVAPLGADAAAELARRLARLLGDAELRARLGRANRARVLERYTRAGMVAAHRAVWEAALAR